MRLVSHDQLSEASIVGEQRPGGAYQRSQHRAHSLCSGMRCALRADILRNRQGPFKPEQIFLTELRQVA